MRKANSAVLARAFSAVCMLVATTSMAAAKRSPDRALPMVVRFTPPTTCEISVADQVFSLPEDEVPMTGALRELRNKWRSVSAVATGDIPYRCVGHAVFIAQRAGFQIVAFEARSPDSRSE
jgi:hypothetical protein